MTFGDFPHATTGLHGHDHGSRRPVWRYRTLGKRCLDLALVLTSAPVTVPVILLLMVMVACDGGRPLYWQTRLGRDGRSFRMCKIRTMVRDADAMLDRTLGSDPVARREWDENQKLRDDPRITRIGRILRKCSLDELPQIWNVLRGDMSLVGPRPMMVSQRHLYPGAAYFDLRPGLSGPWQVSDRNDTTFAARARFDQDYHETLSFRRDVGIIVRTLGVVLRGTGC